MKTFDKQDVHFSKLNVWFVTGAKQ